MNDRDRKRHMAYEALVMMGLLALLLFITRLWPILLLVILGIFIAMLRLLFLSSKKVEPVEPILALPAPKAQHEPSETDMKAMAYVLIQRRITQILEAKYPDVRWIWENPRAQEDIFAGNPVYVILNKAGGYKRGLVLIRNLQVFDVIFDPVPQTDSPAVPPVCDPPKSDPAPQPPEPEEDDEIPEDFGLLAFQWVEAHVIELNDRINEAIGRRETSMLICACELPVRESWIEICKELERNDLTGAVCREDGILIEFEQ